MEKVWVALSSSKNRTEVFIRKASNYISSHNSSTLLLSFWYYCGCSRAFLQQKWNIFFRHSENFSSTHSTFLLFRRRCHRVLGMLSPSDRVQTRRRLRRENAKWMENPGLENMDENYEKCHFTFPPYLILTHNFFFSISFGAQIGFSSFLIYGRDGVHSGSEVVIKARWA